MEAENLNINQSSIAHLILIGSSTREISENLEILFKEVMSNRNLNDEFSKTFFIEFPEIYGFFKALEKNNENNLEPDYTSLYLCYEDTNYQYKESI